MQLVQSGLPATVALAAVPLGPALETLLRRAHRAGFVLGAAVQRTLPDTVLSQLCSGDPHLQQRPSGPLVVLALVRANAVKCLASEVASEPLDRRSVVLLAPSGASAQAIARGLFADEARDPGAEEGCFTAGSADANPALHQNTVLLLRGSSEGAPSTLSARSWPNNCSSLIHRMAVCEEKPRPPFYSVQCLAQTEHALWPCRYPPTGEPVSLSGLAESLSALRADGFTLHRLRLVYVNAAIASIFAGIRRAPPSAGAARTAASAWDPGPQLTEGPVVALALSRDNAVRLISSAGAL